MQSAFRRWGAAGNLVAVICRLFESLFIIIELPAEIDVGPRLRSHHPQGIVLNPRVTLGADRVRRQNVTVGNVIRLTTPAKVLLRRTTASIAVRDVTSSVTFAGATMFDLGHWLWSLKASPRGG